MTRYRKQRPSWRYRLAVLLLASGVLATGAVQAGATFKIDDTKWVSVGAGIKTSFAAVEDSAGVNNDKWDEDFFLNNIRLYINGQLHKYIKLTFNTECHNCATTSTSGGSIRVLDAIARFEFNDYINVWAGRTLVPAERTEMDGPFYNPFFDTFGKSPFEPADFGLEGNTTFPAQDPSNATTGGSAGQFGRDDGVVLWGSVLDKRFKYAAGAFSGLDNEAINTDGELQYGARLAYNFWNVEDNPGYWTSSTYYGKGGDILTLGASTIYHKDGAGAPGNSGDFLGVEGDLLLEKVLANQGVVTLLGEGKSYELTDLNETVARATPGCFCLFDGYSYSAGLLYLFPQQVGIGQLQPYARFSQLLPDGSSDRYELEAGLNYVIDGHNARVSLMYQYGDLATKGIFNFGPNVQGDEVHAVKLGIQLQL